MDWQPKDVILVLTAATGLILILRYAKVLIRTLMALGGLVFIAIAVCVIAIAMGWWHPSLLKLATSLLQLLKVV
jgi:hypothetical protein